MSIIIAAHFRNVDQVRQAMIELARLEFRRDEYATYAREPDHGFRLKDLFSIEDSAPAGPMLAVCVDRPGSEAAAILILSRCGAWEIERCEGLWRDGGWQDYDPKAPREILKEIPGEAPREESE